MVPRSCIEQCFGRRCRRYQRLRCLHGVMIRPSNLGAAGAGNHGTNTTSRWHYWQVGVLIFCMYRQTIAFIVPGVRQLHRSTSTSLHVLSRPRPLLVAGPGDETVPRIHRVEPRKQDLRQRAERALQRQQVESALRNSQSSNEAVLELLSEQFLYHGSASNRPPSVAATTNSGVRNRRPKGRPASVPGAMSFETLLRHRQEEEQQFLSNEQQQTTTFADLAFGDRGSVSSEPAPRRSNVQLKGKASDSMASSTSSLPTTTTRGIVTDDADIAAPPRKRKGVAKNLPPSRTLSSRNGNRGKDALHTFVVDDKMLSNSMDVQKYYRSDLLTPDEEYRLGMKIQFMMMCEDVHEGLAAHLGRLPTMQEWAHACGFVNDDALFVPTEADEDLRPAGSGALFEDLDPSTFVGNGQLGNTGPGSGRGRVKKAPPLRLKDFYDDSDVRHENDLEDAISNGEKATTRKQKLRPANRGTPTDFVEMLMTSRDAKRQMVQSNMRLVISIARKYANVGVSLQDLVQEGSLGLSRAAEKFEPKRGFKFSTYASWWIQQAVFRSIAYHSRTIRLPVHIHNLLARMRKVRTGLASELGRDPTNEEMAIKLGMPARKYNKMLRLTQSSVSLESPKYQGNPKVNSSPRQDLLRDTIPGDVLHDDASPEQSVDHSLFHEDLREMIQVLDDDERKVIGARYGLADGITRTVAAVAAEMKQTKAWVRSQECRALRKLRRPWYEKKLKEHQDALMD